ncbi:hypothetical protein ASPBRDRAFT_32874 [Aspergillus brasiliensis CBS 101740]|uniref:Uncharacterized protein n=1 Tax=Aspergillus brasiliensis (strain CBS 101740 / IMI 381727 / IBT 21946) TaxID=767769 RepID=A0A1L9UC24_ASPBC|nr:hypothetical protein ASPBRDRAFT_32874 [Aspergillus brasiliensis CBS 101740]
MASWLAKDQDFLLDIRRTSAKLRRSWSSQVTPSHFAIEITTELFRGTLQGRTRDDEEKEEMETLKSQERWPWLIDIHDPSAVTQKPPFQVGAHRQWAFPIKTA